MKWSLAEQPYWGGDSDKARTFKGKTRDNYPSAKEFVGAVERLLLEQEKQGQILVLPEATAREWYGDRLTIASLSALEKGENDKGEQEVRIIHDDTTGVDVNKYILVLDGGLNPVASDLKTALRLQAARSCRHFGLAVDVRGAHRIVHVRPQDWPLQACQLVPGGPVYLNKVGTFGVASASYWWGRLAGGLQRCALQIISCFWPLWVLLFADDKDLTAEEPTAAKAIIGYIWILIVLGGAPQLGKIKGGMTYTWIGYEKSIK